MRRRVSPKTEASIRAALNVDRCLPVLYPYPARMSRQLTGVLIEEFSRPGDVVYDPFMGGGTVISEGLMGGRFVIGNDKSSLAYFLTEASTTPVSKADIETVDQEWARPLWVDACCGHTWPDPTVPDWLKNMDDEPWKRDAMRFLGAAIVRLGALKTARQRLLARYALVRLGKWGFDKKDREPDGRTLADELRYTLEETFRGFGTFRGSHGLGLQEWASRAASAAGIAMPDVVNRRRILRRDTVGIDEVTPRFPRPNLVLTSPPYPGVHAVYNRIQIRHRKETALLFWLAGAQGGAEPLSYYTGGGVDACFSMLAQAFKSIRAVAPTALLIQVVGFQDREKHPKRYAKVMASAGYREVAMFKKAMAAEPQARNHARLGLRTGNASGSIVLVHEPV